MFFGCFSKMSAFVVTVPDPIIGAAFIILFGELYFERDFPISKDNVAFILYIYLNMA